MTVEAGRGSRFFEWVNRRIGRVAWIITIGAIVLAFVGLAVESEEDVNFSPSGEIYDTEDRVEDVFGAKSPIRGATFLVEDPDFTGIVEADRDKIDVLSRDALLEWKRNSDTLRADTTVFKGQPLNAPLATDFDLDLGVEINGIFSLADEVDQHLAPQGGLQGATDLDVKLALNELLADDAPTRSLRFTLSQLATAEPAIVDGGTITVWRAPAIRSSLRYSLDFFAGETEDDKELEAELWLREVQDVLRGDQENMEAIGVAIDFNTTFDESFEEGGPFIFLAVALILLLVGALFRSYWAIVLVGGGLGVVMMTYNGIIDLMQLRVSPLLQLIVPIAMIAFGVDFFIHGAGRTREAQVDGFSRERAYPVGLSLVFKALLMAGLSSAAAFLSNAASGIQAITQFGIGAAVALLVGAIYLGLFVPKLLLSMEDHLGPRPAGRATAVKFLYRLAFLLTALFAGVMVAMTVVFPVIGAVIFGVFVLLTIYLPYRLSLRRNARADAAGRPRPDVIRGAGQGYKMAGYVVHFLARWRVVTIPAVLVLAAIGVVAAFQVEQEFDFKDFLPDDTDAVRSLDKNDLHSGESTGEFGYIYVEGDLTRPDTLVAMEEAVAEVERSGVELSRDFDGGVKTSTNSATLVRRVTASPALRNRLGVTDRGDGLPATAGEVAAIYDFALKNDIVSDTGETVFRPDQVAGFLYQEGDTYATRLGVGIPSFIDDEIILNARGALDAAAANLETRIGDQGIDTISVSGEPITFQDTLDSFVRAMLIALPISIVLATLIAAWIMRSLRYAAVAIVPIILVVAWVYGFMFATDLKINPVTATIAAISIGVGIDFAIHFTARFREEFVGEPSRFPALRRAGEGTGGALTLSALTSMSGFFALSLAPTPIFATFGLLTAVMIAFALLVCVIMLPSLLLFVTPSRKGEEREQLIVEITRGELEYEPHVRDTALLRHGGEDDDES
ncbi:MAG: RND family transporter [Acidimicrobiia bacterium]